jgi:hypothetical protein
MVNNVSSRSRTTLLEKMTTATWNIRGRNKNMLEIIKEIKMRKTDITRIRNK